MNKAQDVELAGYVTNPSQIRALLVKLLQHSANVAQSSGERTSRTITRVHSSRRRRGCYCGGEGDNDGWDLGKGDTRSFEIEIKKTDHFAESNRTSKVACGRELQIGSIGGPIRPVVTEIFVFY